MRRILIDTNIYSHAMAGDSATVSVLRQAGLIGICSISIGELPAGFKGGSREPENRTQLGEFLDAPRVRIYGLDEDTAEYYAEILHGLRKAGTPIPTNDIWIAAVAFQSGLKLFAKDKHFSNIPGLILA